MIKVSIVIPIRNQAHFLKQVVFSVLANTKVPFELILVDDNSGRQIKSYLRHLPIATIEAAQDNLVQKVSVYRQKHRKGFPATCNNGIRHAQGEYICLLNTDTWVAPRWLEKMVNVGDSSPDIGILGPSTNIGKQVLDYKQISRMQDYNQIGTQLAVKYAGLFSETYLSGFCFLVKQKVFDEVGVFDERFGIGTGEEGEFTTRAIDAGYKSVWVKDAYVHHFGGKTFRGERINAHRLRAITQQLANAITDERRGRVSKYNIDELVGQVQKFNR